MPEAPKAKICPVCGSENLKALYEDGVRTYRCDNGHNFIIQKKDAADAGED